MGLLLRHKLSGQAASEAEQWRFCTLYPVRLENGARPGGRGNDGESRRLGEGAVMGGELQEACLPPQNQGQRTPAERGCWRTLRCVRVGQRTGIGAWECLGVSVG